MLQTRRGIECRSEGCCVSPQKYGTPESLSQTDRPDAVYPHLWKEILLAVSLLPKGLAQFIYSIFILIVLRRRKRPTWNWSKSMNMIILHFLRSVLKKNSIAFWRILLSVPRISPATKKFQDASFPAKKLNLPGILKEHDEYESGQRKINAQWLFPKEMDNKKAVLYFHGGGYCAKDWKSYLIVTEKLATTTKFPIFCMTTLNYI